MWGVVWGAAQELGPNKYEVFTIKQHRGRFDLIIEKSIIYSSLCSIYISSPFYVVSDADLIFLILCII